MCTTLNFLYSQLFNVGLLGMNQLLLALVSVLLHFQSSSSPSDPGLVINLMFIFLKVGFDDMFYKNNYLREKNQNRMRLNLLSLQQNISTSMQFKSREADLAIKKLIIFNNNLRSQIMSHLAIKSLSVCLIYGVISIFQTLNSRYLYRTLNFNFYSFTFGIQRIAIIIFFALAMKINIRKQMIIKILPYSLFMCLNNIISSYCLTIMPLAAFLAFKKFIVLFILGVTLVFNLPNTTNQTQNYCIIGIVIGGALVGQRDMLHGNVFGYMACLTFNLFQALSLQYSNYLYRHERLQPSQLLLYNCLISLPYYLITIALQEQFDDIYYFFQDKSSFSLILVILFSIFLACISELSSSYIAMKISPFEKSIVANIKDLILMVISVVYLHDYTITPISGFGIVLCLICSALFSVPYLEQKDQPILLHQGDTIQFHHHDGTSLLDDKRHSDHRNSQAQTNDSHHDIMQQQFNHEQSQIIYLKPKDGVHSAK